MISRIQELVDKSGKSANEITKEIGIFSSAFSDWKRGKGKPSADVIVKLANYFGVSTDYLLTGKEYHPALAPIQIDKPEILEIYEQLGRSERVMLVSYGRGLLDITRKKEY